MMSVKRWAPAAVACFTVGVGIPGPLAAAPTGHMSAPRGDLATRMNRDIGQNASFIGERPQVGSRRTDPVDRAPATLQPKPYVIAAPRLFPLFAFGRNPFGEFGSVGCANFSAGSAFASAIAANPLTPIDCSRESIRTAAMR